MMSSEGGLSKFRPSALGTTMTGAGAKILSPVTVSTLQTALQNVETNGSRIDGIFLRSADKNRVMQVRQAIEQGRTEVIVAEEAATLAEALKIFFREMDEPLLTYELYDNFVNAQRMNDEMERVAEVKSCVENLPKAHKDVLYHLISCLVLVSSHSQENRMPAHNLGKVFGTSLLWPRVEHMLSGRLVEDTPLLDGLIETLIKNYQDVFVTEDIEIEQLLDRHSPVDIAELTDHEMVVITSLIESTVDEFFDGPQNEGVLAFATTVPTSSPGPPSVFLAENSKSPPSSAPQTPTTPGGAPPSKSSPTTPTSIMGPVGSPSLVSASAVAKGVAPGEAAPSATRAFVSKHIDIPHGLKHNNEVHAAGWVRIMTRIGLQRENVPTLERRPLIAYCKRIRNEIRSFDKEFAQTHGRYPNSSERQPVRDLHANYQQLKRLVREHAATQIQAVFRGSQTRRESRPLSRGSPSDLDSNDGNKMEDGSASGGKARALSTEAYESGTQSISKLSLDELRELKRRIREKLKAYDTDFEKSHGRPATKADKECMRPLYKRYNEVKLKIESFKGSSGGGWAKSTSPQGHESKAPLPTSPTPRALGSSAGGTESNEQKLEQLKEAKRKLQKKLYKFEMDFTKQHGRKIRTPEDVKPVIDDYKRYKAIKVELEQLERGV